MALLAKREELLTVVVVDVVVADVVGVRGEAEEDDECVGVEEEDERVEPGEVPEDVVVSLVGVEPPCIVGGVVSVDVPAHWRGADLLAKGEREGVDGTSSTGRDWNKGLTGDGIIGFD